MIITLAAITISPKLLVRDCTTIIARENIAWVKPEGNPSFISLDEYSLFSFSIFQFRVKLLFILINLIIQSIADIDCAITVAKATPGTPHIKFCNK